ncbi:Lanosterol 14-alpha-demethylase [Tulasnella sp. 419]|nr:Lanosterol 14-alpha-demethylase [Tulasnella sp. 419]
MEQKRFIKVGLTPENFKLYVDMIEKEVEGYLQTEPGFATYRDGDTTRWGRFNPYKTMAQITILTAARTLQGDEIRSGMDKTFAETYADLDGGFTPLNFMFPNLPLPSYWRRDRAHMKMSNFYVNIIRKRREEGCSVSGHDMIEALSNQTYKDGRPLTDSEVAHIMIALLMAGQHTSSATTSWALLNISSRPDIQQALYDEQVKHFGQADGSLGKLTYEEMKNLPVLDAVIRETLRRHPPIHSIMRKVIAPIDVPPTLAAPSKDAAYHIPKGHYVLASPAFSQVDTRIWKDATNWEPSRWYDADGIAASEYAKYTEEKGEKIDYGYGLVSKGTESQYLPFGAGRHRCIGEQFAYVQVGTIIASIIRRMELQVERRVPDHNYHTMVVLPKEPCGIKYRRRS